MTFAELIEFSDNFLLNLKGLVKDLICAEKYYKNNHRSDCGAMFAEQTPELR